MKRCALFILACATLLGGLPVLAGASPKIAVHVQPRNTGKIATCDVGPAVPCSQFQTAADVNVSYDVYVLVAEGTGAGIGGATFGVEYDSTLDIFGYGLCADLEFPGGGWPASGGGNLITFDVITNCQTSDYGEGIQAQLCWFYV